MKSLSRIVCALVLCTLSSLPARAVSGSSDYSGLWYNASENGWGMNVIQQEQILFATLFIYGTGGAPTWYVASSVAFVSANAAGDRTYTGPLYATTGTPFSTTPYNPGAVTVAAVGSITFVGRADGTATVQYTANSSSVSKTVVRQTWAQPTFTLSTATPYVGAQSSSTSGCTVASNNGPGNSTHSSLALYINANTMRVEINSPPTDGGLCTFQSANYVQGGRFGRATLTGTCSAFPASTPQMRMEAREVEVGANFFTFQYTLTGGPLSAGCTEVGVFTGAKK